jgi:hypothetical protein
MIPFSTSSRTGSDSDLSQLSSLAMSNFQFMNTMQQSLGVVLTSSPLVMLIASLKTSTKDSYDGGVMRAPTINITSSLENINITMTYKKDFNKTAVEVGEIHLDLLLKVFTAFLLIFSYFIFTELFFFRLVLSK